MKKIGLSTKTSIAGGYSPTIIKNTSVTVICPTITATTEFETSDLKALVIVSVGVFSANAAFNSNQFLIDSIVKATTIDAIALFKNPIILNNLEIFEAFLNIVSNNVSLFVSNNNVLLAKTLLGVVLNDKTNNVSLSDTKNNTLLFYV